MNLGPHVPSCGPTPAKIFLLAEAPGTEESLKGEPLVGPSGWELRRMLRTIGVDLNACYKSNVFSRQPMANNLALYGVDRDSASVQARALGPLTTNPITFIADEYLPELSRLREELAAVNPNVVVALGNTACWALGLGQGIGALRGSIHTSHILPDRALKVLPTFHPAAVLRQWDQRTIAIADLAKAHNESHSPDIQFDNTELWLQPTLRDLDEFADLHLRHATVCATDVETKRGQITCMSFAPSPAYSITIPFWQDGERPSYWANVEEELIAWCWCRHWLEKPDLIKVLQNGMYDTQYFLRYGINPVNFTADTMLAHHSLFSELNKGLGFLGSIYANYPNWKSLSSQAKILKSEQLKRDD